MLLFLYKQVLWSQTSHTHDGFDILHPTEAPPACSLVSAIHLFAITRTKSGNGAVVKHRAGKYVAVYGFSRK